MTPILDPKPEAANAGEPKRATRFRDAPELPDLYGRPKRRLPAMVVAGIGFVAAGVSFYGAEAVMPADFKPSTLVGGYQRQIQEAHKTGELAAQVRYDAQAKNIELQFQNQLKQIETRAVQWQEQCRAGLQNFNNLYQASYQRLNIFAQATADIQKQYVAERMRTAENSTQGVQAVANMASMAELFGGLIDPQFGQQAGDFAARARQQALAQLDAAALGGKTLSIEGWNAGLPEPQTIPSMIRCDIPTSDFSPSALTVQPLPQPAVVGSAAN
jgi:hypothetical protein